MICRSLLCPVRVDWIMLVWPVRAFDLRTRAIDTYITGYSVLPRQMTACLLSKMGIAQNGIKVGNGTVSCSDSKPTKLRNIVDSTLFDINKELSPRLQPRSGSVVVKYLGIIQAPLGPGVVIRPR